MSPSPVPTPMLPNLIPRLLYVGKNNLEMQLVPSWQFLHLFSM